MYMFVSAFGYCTPAPGESCYGTLINTKTILMTAFEPSGDALGAMAASWT